MWLKHMTARHGLLWVTKRPRIRLNTLWWLVEAVEIQTVAPVAAGRVVIVPLFLVNHLVVERLPNLHSPLQPEQHTQ
jgi:hypothetical protein